MVWRGSSRAAMAVARFVYGLPEVNRELLHWRRLCVSGVGCNATAVNLALLPLVKAGTA